MTEKPAASKNPDLTKAKILYLIALGLAVATLVYTYFNRCDQGMAFISIFLLPILLALAAVFTVSARFKPKSRLQQGLLGFVVGLVVAVAVYSALADIQSSLVTDGITQCYGSPHVSVPGLMPAQ